MSPLCSNSQCCFVLFKGIILKLGFEMIINFYLGCVPTHWNRFGRDHKTATSAAATWAAGMDRW